MIGEGLFVTSTEIIETLNRADAGEIGVTWNGETFDEHYSNNFEFQLSNGWKLIVFCDCGEWDYVDSVVLDDGTTIAAWFGMEDVAKRKEGRTFAAEDADAEGFSAELADWKPKNWARWGAEKAAHDPG